MTDLPSPARLCRCGCGRPLPAQSSARRRFSSEACRQRAHRDRLVQRQRDAAEALSRDLSGRDLGAILRAAVQADAARPGSVVLRVAGRLYALTGEELGRMVEALG